MPVQVAQSSGIVPLYGHATLRNRLRRALERAALPASLLLHGPAGIGKQRLALWLGQMLVCEGADPPCGKCKHCHMAASLHHPDLHWYFPLPRPKDSSPTAEDARQDLAEAREERLETGGLYAPPASSDIIYLAMVRALLGDAALSPAMARRKVFIVGDAERMAPNEGGEMAANAFLKLLEEPPANAFLILTSSEPAALLPTIRSRVVSIRVAPLAGVEVGSFLQDPAVQKAADKAGVPKEPEARAGIAGGTPGRLFVIQRQRDASSKAQRILSAATSGRPVDRWKVAFATQVTDARGGFTEILEALVVILHQQLRTAVAAQDDQGAVARSRAMLAVEAAKGRAEANHNPQLIVAGLVNDISEAFAWAT